MDAVETYFRRHPLTYGLTPSECASLVDATEVKRVPRRIVMWEQGSSAASMLFVRSGVLRLSMTRGHSEVILDFASRGRMVGTPLPTIRRSRTVTVHEQAVLYEVAVDRLNEILDAPGRRHRLLHWSLERRVAQQQWMSSLLSRTVPQRLVSVLLQLRQEFGVRDSRGVIINLRLTHKQLAQMVGATRETVSFAILELRKAKLLQSDGKRIILLDMPRLLATLES